MTTTTTRRARHRPPPGPRQAPAAAGPALTALVWQAPDDFGLLLRAVRNRAERDAATMPAAEAWLAGRLDEPETFEEAA